jgi:hypothetical protein
VTTDAVALHRLNAAAAAQIGDTMLGFLCQLATDLITAYNEPEGELIHPFSTPAMRE